MKFWLSLTGEPLATLVESAVLAEELGYEGVVLGDHVLIKDGSRTPYQGPNPLEPDHEFPDPLVVFAATASRTTRLRFLTSVFVVPLSDPSLLAKQVGTLAALSDNRFVLGAGVGWLREEFDAVGVPFATRGSRTDEILAIMRDFWQDGYAQADTRHFTFPRSGMFPVATGKIPIWIGGHSRAAATRAAAHDGYMPMRGLTAETLEEFRLIDQLRAEQGSRGPFERTVSSFGLDSVAAARDAEERYGVTSVIVYPSAYRDNTLTVAQKRQRAADYAEKVVARMA